jgi:hypothetical protein
MSTLKPIAGFTAPKDQRHVFEEPVGTRWQAWKTWHWPLEIVRPGVVLRVFDTTARAFIADVTVTRGGGFTYASRRSLIKGMIDIVGWEPDYSGAYWQNAPMPPQGKDHFALAFQWTVTTRFFEPWSGRFPQLGWIDLDAQSYLDGAFDPDAAGLEGDAYWVKHRQLERNSKLVLRARVYWRRTLGELRCAVCHFSFERRYGTLGADYIEMHHVTHLHKGARKTRPRDLIPVCANCHRMLHRTRQGVTLEELRRILAS